jgi:hypothetical protein
LSAQAIEQQFQLDQVIVDDQDLLVCIVGRHGQRTHPLQARCKRRSFVRRSLLQTALLN